MEKLEQNGEGDPDCHQNLIDFSWSLLTPPKISPNALTSCTQADTAKRMHRPQVRSSIERLARIQWCFATQNCYVSSRNVKRCAVTVKSLSSPPLKPISQLRFDYDTTTIRRYHDAFDYDGNDRNYDLRSIRLRYEHDVKIDMFVFLLASNRVEWKQARAIRRSRIAVVS